MTASTTTVPSYPMTISAVQSASLGDDLVWAHKDQKASHAETLMLLHKFSQIPVFNHGKRPLRNKLAGMATWQSLARARLVSSDPNLGDSMADAVPPVVDKDADLFAAIPGVLAAEVVLVQAEGEICGMVTAHDLADWLSVHSEPFCALVETEALLRDLAVRYGCDAMAEDPSMGDCISELGREETWRRLGTNHDRATIIKALNQVREIRNRLMHGRGRATDDTQHCRNLLDYLRALTSAGSP